MENKEEFICIKCNKQFSDKYKLKQHYGKKIDCVRILKCDVCNKICNTKQNLFRHMNKQKKCRKIESNNIANVNHLTTPINLIQKISPTDQIKKLVYNTKIQITNILNKKSDKLIVIVGPCSIHDTKAAYDYAKSIKEISDLVSDELIIIMRTYFEKSDKTEWKGLINDCTLDKTHDINKGIYLARKLLFDINELQVPVALEFLDNITPPFLSDLVSWGCIGARTVDSILHKNLASGLSMPIGFKNDIYGNTDISIDSILYSQEKQCYLGINEYGMSSILSSTGNKNCHIILRGSKYNTNYDNDNLDNVCEKLQNNNLNKNIMIDCGHDNSKNDYNNQVIVCNYISDLISKGNNNIIGIMLQSNIYEGKQDLIKGQLKYGISVTDSCIDLQTTKELLLNLSNSIKKKRLR